MPRKKKPARWSMLQIAGAVAVVLGITGGFVGLENHWVNYPYHGESSKSLKSAIDKDLAQLSKTLEIIQHDAALNAAYTDLYYWRRTETDLKAVKMKLGKSPSREFDDKLNEAIDCRKQAEDRVQKLKEAK